MGIFARGILASIKSSQVTNLQEGIFANIRFVNIEFAITKFAY